MYITRYAAIMDIILPIMLFRCAQNFVRLCIRWTPIMPKLFHNCLYADGGLAFISCFLMMSVCMCGAFSLSKNKTMSHWQIELPAYTKLFLPPAIASYPGSLTIWVCKTMPAIATRKYNYLIRGQKGSTHQILLENLPIMLALCFSENPLIIPEAMPA